MKTLININGAGIRIHIASVLNHRPIQGLAKIAAPILVAITFNGMAADSSISLTNSGSAVASWDSGLNNFDLKSSTWAASGGIVLGNGMNFSRPIYSFYLPPPQFVSGVRELTSITVMIYGKGWSGGSGHVHIGPKSVNDLNKSEAWNVYGPYYGSDARNLLVFAGTGQPYRLDVKLNLDDILGNDWYDLKEVVVQYTYSGIPQNWLEAFQLATGAAQGLTVFRSNVKWGEQGVFDLSRESFDAVVMSTMSGLLSDVLLPTIPIGDPWLDLVKAPFDLEGIWDEVGAPLSGPINWQLFWTGYPTLNEDIFTPLDNASGSLSTLSADWQSALADGSLVGDEANISSAIDDAVAKAESLRVKLDNAATDIRLLRLMSSDPNYVTNGKIAIQSLAPLMRYDGNEQELSDSSYIPQLKRNLNRVRASVKIGTLPAGVGLYTAVDGNQSTSDQNLNWIIGVSHTISAPSSQTGADSKNYVFQGWNDGISSNTRMVSPSSDSVYTAIYADSTGNTLIFYPNADATISSNNPTLNYGDSSILYVGTASSAIGRRDSLIKFDLSSIPAGSTINSVTLTLTHIGALVSDVMELLTTSTAWSESGVTWNNRPSFSTSIGVVGNGSSQTWEIKSIDYSMLAIAVSNWISNPSANYGFYLRANTGSSGLAFDSRENAGSGIWPTLSVTYQPPSDTEGDAITGLAAKTYSGGSVISPDSWQQDDSPYFYWNVPSSVSPIVGYSYALNATPSESVNLTVPYFQCPAGFLVNGYYTFCVRSVDASGNWGPSASFEIWVDREAPSYGTITINNDAAFTASLTVSFNNLSALDNYSGLKQMRFSNDGNAWSSWEPYASVKTGWNLSAFGGNSDYGTKVVYVQFKDAAGNTSSNFMHSIVYAAPPFISRDPSNQCVVIGGNATFSVAVTGTGPFTYQWLFNGTNIPNSIITTLAGNGSSGYSGDGSAATNASQYYPSGVALDSSGDLFIADYGNNRIRKVNTNGIITTVAGNGANGFSGDGGPATNASLCSPWGVAVDTCGNLFVADYGNNRIRKVNTNGIITTVAGNGANGFSGDGGPATNASLANPTRVAVDACGKLFIADANNNRIRKVNTNGIITTVVGNGTYDFSGDGGPATNACLNGPFSVALDSFGDLFIADYGNHRIRKVNTNGIITTVAGGPGSNFPFLNDGIMATNAWLYWAVDVAVDPFGKFFIADVQVSQIYRVDNNGIITKIVGNGFSGYSGDGGQATNATLNYPYGVAVDASDNLFIADYYNNRIRKVSSLQGPALILTNLTGADGGDYRVVVTGPAGSVTSHVATLTITIPLVIKTNSFSLGFAARQFHFILTGPAGSNAIISASTNLQTWIPLGTNPLGGGSLTFTDALSTNYPKRFYRAVLQ